MTRRKIHQNIPRGGHYAKLDALVETMTPNEIERYAPHHLWPEFEIGYREYIRPGEQHTEFKDVAGQAYDRGAEMAMRRAMQKLRETDCVKRSSGY